MESSIKVLFKTPVRYFGSKYFSFLTRIIKEMWFDTILKYFVICGKTDNHSSKMILIGDLGLPDFSYAELVFAKAFLLIIGNLV